MLVKTDAVILLALSFIGIVFAWRGMWNLIDTYFMPRRYLMSNILSIVIGALLLLFVIHMRAKNIKQGNSKAMTFSV